MILKEKALRYRALLLKAHGVYITYRGKALNPEDVKVVFGETKETFIPMLKLLEVVKEIVSISFLESLFRKRWKSKN